MTPAELQQVRDGLLRARVSLAEAGSFAVRAELDSPVASARDQDEAPLVVMGQTIASARNRERVERLYQIDDALRRLIETPDAYGRCEVCGEPIPVGRLTLMPFATSCVPCLSATEVSPKGGGRRKVTDFR